MRRENKTVIEVSKESKKTRQTIYNHLNKLKEDIPESDIDQYFIKYDDVTYLTPLGQIYIYKSLGLTKLAKRIEKEETKEEPRKDQAEYTSEYIKSLQDQIKFKDEQIKTKDDQIKSQLLQIEQLTSVIDRQSQQLAIESGMKAKEYIDLGYKTNDIEESRPESKKTFFEKLKDLFNWWETFL